MKRPDLKEMKRTADDLSQLNTLCKATMAERDAYAGRIRDAADALRLDAVRASLADISTEELKRSKAGIRVQVLMDAG